jgi:hypothetical protein
MVMAGVLALSGGKMDCSHRPEAWVWDVTFGIAAD